MKDCKKTGRFVVFVQGANEKDVAFCCGKHIGEHAQAALLDAKGKPVRVAYASCDDAPCQSGA